MNCRADLRIFLHILQNVKEFQFFQQRFENIQDFREILGIDFLYPFTILLSCKENFLKVREYQRLCLNNLDARCAG